MSFIPGGLLSLEESFLHSVFVSLLADVSFPDEGTPDGIVRTDGSSEEEGPSS